MKFSFPNLTRKTTMWKAWIGFNASHSAGGIFIGISNFYVAAKYFSVFNTDHVFFPVQHFDDRVLFMAGKKILVRNTIFWHPGSAHLFYPFLYPELFSIVGFDLYGENECQTFSFRYG